MLVIVGKSIEDPVLKKLAADAGVENHVSFEGLAEYGSVSQLYNRQRHLSITSQKESPPRYDLRKQGLSVYVFGSDRYW